MPTVQCSCGHEWTTRKHLEEIETLRCSSCGTASRDDLSISDDADQSPRESSIVTEVEAAAKRKDLLERVDALLARAEGTAPDESEHEVAREVRGECNRLRRLQSVLEEDGEDFSLDELRATAEYVDELESGIDEHADQLERVANLESTVENLESAVSELRHERSGLKTEIGELQDEFEQLSRRRNEFKERVGELREDASAYSQGYEKAMEHFEITIPCVECGGPIRMEPGSPMHRVAIDLLQQNGWHHSGCGSTQAQTGQRSW